MIAMRHWPKPWVRTLHPCKIADLQSSPPSDHTRRCLGRLEEGPLLCRARKNYRATRLVYCEAHDWMTSAIQRESSLKRWKRDWKIELIESVNPNWDDLERTLI